MWLHLRCSSLSLLVLRGNLIRMETPSKGLPALVAWIGEYRRAPKRLENPQNAEQQREVDVANLFNKLRCGARKGILSGAIQAQLDEVSWHASLAGNGSSHFILERLHTDVFTLGAAYVPVCSCFQVGPTSSSSAVMTGPRHPKTRSTLLPGVVSTIGARS